VAPALGDLEVDFLLAGVASLGAAQVESGPGADDGKVAPGPAPVAAQVVPGGEVWSVAGEDDDLDVVVARRAVERGVQLVGHLQSLRIARFRPRHRDARDMGKRYLVADLLGCLG